MKINRDRFLEEGYLTVREAIPPSQLEVVRVAYELLVSYQREIRARAAGWIHDLKRPDADTLPEASRNQRTRTHPITLYWGEEFADRFTSEEARRMWDRFSEVDVLIREDSLQCAPGFQGGESHCHFIDMPDSTTFDRVISTNLPGNELFRLAGPVEPDGGDEPETVASYQRQPNRGDRERGGEVADRQDRKES
jgi:hypothetical protein